MNLWLEYFTNNIPEKTFRLLNLCCFVNFVSLRFLAIYSNNQVIYLSFKGNVAFVTKIDKGRAFNRLSYWMF